MAGISSLSTIFNNKLFSGLPQLMAGPLCPPRRTPRNVRRSSPASRSSIPWHLTQCWRRSGAISFSKCFACWLRDVMAQPHSNIMSRSPIVVTISGNGWFTNGEMVIGSFPNLQLVSKRIGTMSLAVALGCASVEPVPTTGFGHERPCLSPRRAQCLKSILPTNSKAWQGQKDLLA